MEILTEEEEEEDYLTLVTFYVGIQLFPDGKFLTGISQPRISDKLLNNSFDKKTF